VNVPVSTEAGSSARLNVARTSVARATSVAPAAGDADVAIGGAGLPVLSTTTRSTK
jgi:hypothetical protein